MTVAGELKRIDAFKTQFTRGKVKEAMEPIKLGSSEVWKVRPDALRTAPGFNTRIMTEELKAHIRWIADRIHDMGFDPAEPLAGYVAFEGGEQVVYVTGGHCRHAATTLAISEGKEIESVPIIIAPKGTTMEDLTVQLVTQNSGKPLTTFEKGLVCKRLMGFGWDVDKVCSKLGLASKQYVEGLLELVGSPLPIREMVIAGEASADVAIAALRKYGDRAYEELQVALGNAKASGKTKATGKFMPGAIYTKAVKKAAPEMLTTLRGVTQDPGYAHLSAELREKLDKVLQQLAEVEKQDKTAAAAAAGANDAGGETRAGGEAAPQALDAVAA